MSKQKAVIVAVALSSDAVANIAATLEELTALLRTMNISVVAAFSQNRTAYDARTHIGKGKLAEIHAAVERYDADIVVFDDELPPKQQQNLETELETSVIDRTQVIIQIFVDHATTLESRAQVELAQVRYQLPRLSNMWSHLDRERGGGVTSRGMGEKQITVDKRLLRSRISTLEAMLAKIQNQRSTQAKNRQSLTQVCLVGYTNAGKSTLMNCLTDANVLSEDALFATLESTTRKITKLPDLPIVLTDTVGFIAKLPHDLVASFHATLRVVTEADVLLHVVDAHNPEYQRHLETTMQVLQEIGAAAIPQILVWNTYASKQQPQCVQPMQYPCIKHTIELNALAGEHIDDLLQLLDTTVLANYHHRNVNIPIAAVVVLDQLRKLAVLRDITYTAEHVSFCVHYRSQVASKIDVLLGEL